MSSLSMSAPKKISDAQFIGDLMNLFERRKIPVGDPASFATFETEIASNDLLRSGLFTLCTAISHMAEADLSGEELLVLVARALAGPAMAKGAAPLEIPDGMRSAFLNGYEAWSNRGFEIKEPLPWPAPRPAAQRDEPPATEPLPEETAEPIAARAPSPGVRTLQEALELAKIRFPAEPAAPRQPQPSAIDGNVDGLTLSELKSMLEDMEHRVTRMQPQVRELNSMGRPAAEFSRREKMHEIDEAVAAHAQESDTPTHRSPSPSRLNEAAFLARHAYLRPTTRRVLPEVTVTGGYGRPAATAPAAAASAPFATAAAAPVVAAAPPPPVAAMPATPVSLHVPFVAAALAAVPQMVPGPVATSAAPMETPGVAPGTAITLAPIASAQALVPEVHAQTTQLLAELREAMLAAQARAAAAQANSPTGSVYFRIGRFRLGPSTVLGTLLAFIIIAGGLGGIVLYPSLHPYYFYRDSRLLPANSPAVDSTQTAAPAADPASVAQVILTAPDAGSMAQPLPSPRMTGGAGSKGRAEIPPSASVWPATGAAASVAIPAASPVPYARSATRRTAAPSAPVYVPSTTIIGYALSAPQPVYPRDLPKGIVGTVVVQVTISPDGQITDIRTLSGPVEMRPATVQAVQAWRFKPYMVNGNPVEVTTTLGFLFKGQ